MSEPELDNKGIVLTGMITVIITIISCLMMIIIYFISYLQIKFEVLIDKNTQPRNKTRSILDNGIYPSENELDETKNKNENNKSIGLGSNFMFLLILSNFLGGINELLLFVHYRDTEGQLDFILCNIYGVIHNFFELCGICWTSMLTYLFYCSTKASHEIFYKENKYLLIGFIYSLLISIIFGLGPLLNNYYGEKNYLCFFKYSKDDENNAIFISIWNICNGTVIALNCICNCFWLYKTFGFYAKKAHIIKKKSLKEYKQLLIYIWVFRMFPIVLILTGLIKVSTRIIGNFLNPLNLLTKILGYSNVIIHNLNGFFNSLACFYFFRGVFWCCIKEDDDEEISNDYFKEMPEKEGETNE